MVISWALLGVFDIVLVEIINDWLHDNPYLVAGMEIRRANRDRFNVSRCETQTCWLHIVFSGLQVHFWYTNGEMATPKKLFALGYIDHDFVAFTWDLECDYLEEMSPANPKFFEWLESCFKRIIQEAEAQDVGSIRKTES